MNIRELVISTIKGELHLGSNAKNDCIKYIEDLEFEIKVLEKRLSHLLESNFISKYDKKNPLTSNYELDINELDKIMEQSEIWQKENPAFSSNDDPINSLDELLLRIKQGYKRIKVTKKLYAELEHRLDKAKRNNDIPISSFFGIEIYIDL